MEQKILKPWQEQVIEFIFAQDQLQNFYLTGGTALSGYYLQHRVSDDLDFFSFNDFDSMFLHGVAESLKEVMGAKSVRFSKLYDRNQFFYTVNEEENKIEFTKYPFKQLQEVNDFNGARVDSEYDIAVNKLMTIVDRFDPKDFVDLFFLLQKYDLMKLKEGVQSKFGHRLDPLTIGSSFSRARKIEALPKMIKSLTVEELKDFFNNESKKLSSDIMSN